MCRTSDQAYCTWQRQTTHHVCSRYTIPGRKQATRKLLVPVHDKITISHSNFNACYNRRERAERDAGSQSDISFLVILLRNHERMRLEKAERRKKRILSKPTPRDAHFFAHPSTEHVPIPSRRHRRSHIFKGIQTSTFSSTELLQREEPELRLHFARAPNLAGCLAAATAVPTRPRNY